MKKIFLYTAAALALTACSNDNEPAAPAESDVATITAQIGEVQSRAANTSWAAGDKIGITTTGNTKEYVNMEYTVGNPATGSFTGNPIYFQKNSVDVTFTAYYPFAGTEGTAAGVISGNTCAANQTAAAQPSVDYLWAQATGSRQNHDINFTFAHKMSKLTLTFKNGDDTDVSDITAYTIGGLKHEGTFNTADGTAVATAEAAENLTIPTSGVTNGNAVVPVILYPQEVTANSVTLAVVLDGETYNCVLPVKDNKLASRSNYNYTIKINKTGMTVVGSTITNWTDVNNGEINAEM